MRGLTQEEYEKLCRAESGPDDGYFGMRATSETALSLVARGCIVAESWGSPITSLGRLALQLYRAGIR